MGKFSFTINGDEPEAPNGPEGLDPQLQERIFELLSVRFRPAKDAGEADHFYTTEQLFAFLADHEPNLFEVKPVLRSALVNLGYHEHFLGDQYVWAVCGK
jgi:hypothetical protein